MIYLKFKKGIQAPLLITKFGDAWMT